MSEKFGKCPGCDSPGVVGSPCEEMACSRLGYHFIPDTAAVDVPVDPEAEREPGYDPIIGQMIGDFLVVDHIGAGGFGRVYLALQAPLFRLKGALKLVEFPSQNAVVVEAMLDKFRQEAEALADLAHPNIVRLLKYGMHKGRPYLVMEYVGNGRTLREDIWHRAKERRSFSHDEVIEIIEQVLNALEAAHERSIIHRDIKPENIMIQPVAGHPNHLKVLDFGTAKFTEDREDTKWPLGSPSYMAPEQIEMKGIGPWSDLFAVGVVAFELMIGRRPYPGSEEVSIVGKKLDRDYDPLSQLVGLDVPELTRAFFRRALATDASERFRRVEEFREALGPAVKALGAQSRFLKPSGPELTALLDSGDLLDFEAHDQPTRNGAPPAPEPDVPPPLPVVTDDDAADHGNGDRRGGRIVATIIAVLVVAAGGALLFAGRYLPDPPGPPPTATNEAVEPPAPAPVVTALPDAASDGAAAQDAAAMADTRADAETADAADVGGLPPGIVSGRITAITAGKFHSCMATRKGLVRCWGANFDGELGLGHDRTMGDDEPLSKIPWIEFEEPVVQLESAGDRGSSFNCALSPAGFVRCWGSNSTGQLGLGHTKAIGDLNIVGGPGHGYVHLGGPVKDIAVGGAQYGSHACALLRDGTLRCWGGNKAGQLGLGHTRSIGDDELPERVEPADVGGRVRDVDAGKHHTCALLESGEARCWGFNKDGQLGLGHTDSIGDDESPASAPPIDVGFDVASIVAGRGHTCAVSTSGQAKCWGWNNASQLGYGHTDTIGDDELPSSAPIIDLPAPVDSIVAGSLHTCALLDGGRVKCWGDNKFGQLGYGHENPVLNPATVGDVILGGEVARLYAGSYHTCAVLMDDTMRCWGYNKYGQLGLGHTRDIGDDEPPASVPAVNVFVEPID